ncbi:MAG: hypothetical protein IJA87_03115 [Clostridia bacterium]|nr:hypothetical protein [Clostridia bacterium]
MKIFKKLTALLLAVATVFTLASCGMTKSKLKPWFNDEFSVAYNTCFKDNKEAPFPDISLMLTSSSYLNSVFDYITDGTQPEAAEITEEDGVYIYKAQSFTQKVELDKSTSSVRVTSLMEFNGEAKTNFIVTMREHKNTYYIQYLSPEFSTYYEVSFTAETSSIKYESRKDIPYTIFGEKIPDTFAKEN